MDDKKGIEKLYSSSEVCTILNISKGTLYCWCKYGIIKYIKMGVRNPRYRFTQEAIDEVIHRNINQAPGNKKNLTTSPTNTI